MTVAKDTPKDRLARCRQIKNVLGLDKQDFYVWSTAGNERRNGPDDVDVCLYSVRKCQRL